MSRQGQNFNTFAHGLLNKEVEVITSEGTYTGTLVYVGSDTIILQSRIRGRSVRLAIRIALIVALFRLTTNQRGLWSGPSESGNESSDNVRGGGF
ncbi:hypothetical protein [Bacillus sp. EB600]|uniref:hypothetical protein n=1 Tax=Bacillus sp. EB600 TaxID=2806345 RepID=UPI00210CEAA7|nr:hypothetical protein [Bacillus sp. EB600]MCQ6282048.1 hypothetical protein [Bacillus sp. EB600]